MLIIKHKQINIKGSALVPHLLRNAKKNCGFIFIYFTCLFCEFDAEYVAVKAANEIKPGDYPIVQNLHHQVYWANTENVKGVISGFIKIIVDYEPCFATFTLVSRAIPPILPR